MHPFILFYIIPIFFYLYIKISHDALLMMNEKWIQSYSFKNIRVILYTYIKLILKYYLFDDLLFFFKKHLSHHVYIS